MKSLNAIRDVLILSLLVVTPFLVTTFTYELFEFPKMMFVYTVTILLIALSFTQWIVNSKKLGFKYLAAAGRRLVANKKLNVTTLVILFVVANAISTTFSPYLYTSLWGYYSRFSGGLISVFCYLAIYLILKNLEKEKLAYLSKILVFMATLVSVYGVTQHFGLEKDRWVQDVGARVFSSFGQPNWLAAFLVLILPLNLYFLIKESLLWRKIFYLAVAVTNFTALWFSFSVSGITAFAVCFLLFVTFLEKGLRRENWQWLALLVILGGVVCLWQPGLAASRFQDTVVTVMKRVGLLKPAIAATAKNYIVGDTGDIRLIVWQGILNEVISSPKNLLIGTGPETVAYTFLAFRPAEMNQTSEGSFLYNKTHNYFLDLLSNTGLLGLTTYLLINIVAIATAFKKRSNPLLLALGVGLLGNIVTNFFGWPTVTSTLIFFFYLANISQKDYEQKEVT